MELNAFDKCGVHDLRPRNTENFEPEIKKIWYKSQDKNEYIFHNNLNNARLDQITDMVHKFYPPILGQFDNVTWVHENPLPFF